MDTHLTYMNIHMENYTLTLNIHHLEMQSITTKPTECINSIIASIVILLQLLEISNSLCKIKLVEQLVINREKYNHVFLLCLPHQFIIDSMSNIN